MRTAQAATLAIILGAASTALGGEPRWKQHTVNAKSAFEAAGVLDVNRDGKLDIVSGDTWYEGPNWTPHHTRDVTKQGTYYNCFAALPLDADGDGDADYVTVGYFTKNVGWVENPGDSNTPWTYHEIGLPGTSGPWQPVRAQRADKGRGAPVAGGRKASAALAPG